MAADKLGVAALAAAIIALPIVALAQPQPDYHPSLGDMMTMSVQPRHIKLGVAGKAGNWAYAAYEASELRNGFGRVAKTIPIYRKADMAAQFASGTTQPLDRIDAAIKAHDLRRFRAAYTELTGACNACHKSLEHPFIVIREPAVSSYSDQVLAPSRTRPGR